MADTPTVSVLISTHNRPWLVMEAIWSVLDQTYQDFEIIVIDDGQDARADESVRSFGDERIHYIQNDESRGCAGSRNVGIEAAGGEYVAFLDDDDTWKPEKLKKQMQALERAPQDVAFSFTGAEEHFDDRVGTTTVPDGVGWYHEYALSKFGGMLSSTLVIRRDVFDEVGLFSEEFPTHTDIDVMIRVTEAYRGVGINEPLVVRTIKSGHQQMGSDLSRRIGGRLMLFEKYREKFEARPAVYAKHIARLAEFYRDSGRYAEARRTFRRAWRTSFLLKNLLREWSMCFGGVGYRMFRWSKSKGRNV